MEQEGLKKKSRIFYYVADIGSWPIHISTWSYENWVSKHFVISLNFPCLIASLLSCLLVFFCLFCG